MREILVIRLSAIGDVIHCTPVASSLKAAWPDCRITWLVGEVAADLVRYNPYVDETIVWSRERFERHLRDFELGRAASLWRELRDSLAGRRYYAVLDVHGLFLTGVIARLAETERRIGLSGTKELNALFMDETAAPVGHHITDRYLGVLRPLGIVPTERRPMLAVPEKAEQAAEALLSELAVPRGGRIAALAPGTTWPAKNWPAALYARTARRLAGDFAVMLCGGSAEAALGREIAAAAGVPVADATGRTGLLELAALFAKASVVVAGDTGPLYMAAAVGTPTVGIFGPTDPARLAPPGEKNAFVVSRQACSFCYRKTCPKGVAVCMSGVNPELVVRQVYRVAGRPRPRVPAAGSGFRGAEPGPGDPAGVRMRK
ncbi:glycosyltransferase family 9 protein [Anaeroselena agilis]|uniref:Glycosyltransferase family 9 protein n=1 Tax=Anaeroselena agilis TaxID=3063788 RepID=A0ABU3NSS9_9FIRM|nr:glycosyltransferase family 9 protein [Selenomonadales bacterium 4137-cl]